jgi:hypothetical protein
MHDHRRARALYKKLITLYPRGFGEQFGEPMEQTFSDLYKEQKRQTEGRLFGFMLWMFLETAIGILREHLLLASPGGIMQNLLKTIGSSALLGVLLILPFIILEVVNRREFNEEFPFVLFFVLWLNLFALILILLPIMQGRGAGNKDKTNPVPTRANTLLTNPKAAGIISGVLVLFIIIVFVLGSIRWEPLERLFNGPDPEQFYLPGQLFGLALISIPVMAGMIAGRPIVSALQAGGSLFAHPLHLLIVVVISFLFAAGFAGLIVDQWPCFIGVPNCD